MHNKWYRNPKTLNEIKQYFAAVDSNFITIRAKRAPKNLPNSWDDIWFANRKIETRRQRLQARPNYRESIRFILKDEPLDLMNLIK